MTATLASNSGARTSSILIVDDEPNIAYLLRECLLAQGFNVKEAHNPTDALAVVTKEPPDAMILDVMLPGMDGYTLLRRVREMGAECPVLFLTARDSLEDKLTGLTIGGDDYVTKPFSLEEVVARLRVILRRAGKSDGARESPTLVFEDIELNEETHEVWKTGKLVSLSPTEFTLLRYFMVNARIVLSKRQILEHVWHYDFGGDMNVVESYVSYLRRKIDTGEKKMLQTLRGVGYVLREPR